MTAQYGTIKPKIIAAIKDHPDWTLYKIADDIGTTFMTVQTIAYGLGFKVPSPREKRLDWDDAELSKLRQFISEGRNMRQICREMGIYKMALTDGLFILATGQIIPRAED